MTIVWILALLAAGAVGFALGRKARPPAPPAVPARPPADPDREARERARAQAQEEARHQALREEARQQALREALGRVAAFLRENVRAPLEEGRRSDQAALDAASARAVGAVEDLEFFLQEPATDTEVVSLVPLVQQVAREYAADWEVAVRLRLPEQPVRADLHPTGFMDALYLLLHNAGVFGEGRTIDVTVVGEAGRARVTIRDRGPGFTEEALRKAHDLFYSTTPSGLGLGIPHARKMIEGFGGGLTIRNAEGGGAEVELSLPLA